MGSTTGIQPQIVQGTGTFLERVTRLRDCMSLALQGRTDMPIGFFDELSPPAATQLYVEFESMRISTAGGGFAGTWNDSLAWNDAETWKDAA